MGEPGRAERAATPTIPERRAPAREIPDACRTCSTSPAELVQQFTGPWLEQLPADVSCD